MRLSRTLMLIGALALPALPAAAQGKALGKPAGVGKPTTTTARGPVTKGKSADAQGGTLVKGKSADHAKGPKTTTDLDDTTASGDSETKGRGQLPLGEKLALNDTLRTRLEGLLEGGSLTYDQATTGWKNQGQLVAAMNAAKNNNLSFASLYTEMVTNQKSLSDAVTVVKSTSTTTNTTTTTTSTTTTAQ